MQAPSQSIRLFTVYEQLNKALFDSQLSDNVLVKDGYKKSDGHYIFGKWDDEQKQKKYDEILINENLFNNPKEYWLAVFVHQMIHKWQHDFGNKKVPRHYHNKEYVEKAVSIGLNIESGYDNEQSIDPKGKFMQAIQTVNVDSMLVPRNAGSQLVQESKSGKWFKFVCPNCERSTRGKFDTEVDCRRCKKEMMRSDK